MKQPQAARGADLRNFRWQLHAAERRLEGAVEGARLVVAGMQQELQGLDERVQGRLARQRELEQGGMQQARHDVHAGAHLVRYLARLEADRRAAEAARAAQEQRLAAARVACAEQQRQLECVQALRGAAQRQHAQEQLRRAYKEADAGWLAVVQQRRAAAAPAGREAELPQRPRPAEGLR